MDLFSINELFSSFVTGFVSTFAAINIGVSDGGGFIPNMTVDPTSKSLQQLQEEFPGIFERQTGGTITYNELIQSGPEAIISGNYKHRNASGQSYTNAAAGSAAGSRSSRGMIDGSIDFTGGAAGATGGAYESSNEVGNYQGGSIELPPGTTVGQCTQSNGIRNGVPISGNGGGNPMAQAAIQEYQLWNNGRKKECSFNPVLRKYWNYVGWSKWSCSGDPWSAAFISYVTKIQKAAAHSQYISGAINGKNGWNYFPIKNKPIQIGDLVCKTRGGGRFIGVDAIKRSPGRGYISHCDLVVEANYEQGHAVMLGGNVSDTTGRKVMCLNQDGTANWPVMNIGVLSKNGGAGGGLGTPDGPYKPDPSYTGARICSNQLAQKYPKYVKPKVNRTQGIGKATHFGLSRDGSLDGVDNSRGTPNLAPGGKCKRERVRDCIGDEKRRPRRCKQKCYPGKPCSHPLKSDCVGISTEDPNLVGVALPSGLLKSLGGYKWARNSAVEVRNTKGQVMIARIVDVGPGQKQLNQGKIMDETYALNKAMGGDGSRSYCILPGYFGNQY